MSEDIENLDNQTLFAEACNLLRAGRLEESLPLLYQVIQTEPTDPLALRTIGEACQSLKRFDDAIYYLRRALAHDPTNGGIWGALGSSYGWIGEWAKSRECYDRSLHFAPYNPETLWNRSLNRLLHGDFRAGWQEYLWGINAKQKKMRTLVPEWRCQPVKRLFLWSEQGQGDTIQFLPLVKRAIEVSGATSVTLEVQQSLIPLLVSQEWLKDVTLIEMQRDNCIPVEFDAHAGLMSLPAILGLQMSDLPLATNYITAPNPYVNAAGSRLRVGVAWKGSSGHGNAFQRDIPIEVFDKLLHPVGGEPAWKGVQWVHLQQDAAPLYKYFDTPCLTSWADTANVISSLDLVITCDTAVAHLSAAMGKETWILIPFVQDWRWFLDRTDSPWYPSVKLFRQQTRGDWLGVINAVSVELQKRAGFLQAGLLDAPPVERANRHMIDLISLDAMTNGQAVS